MEEVLKLKARINDRDLEVILLNEGERVVATVAGRKYELEVHRSDDDSYLVFNNEHVYDCRVTSKGKSRESFEVDFGGNSYSIDVSDPKRLRSDQNSDKHHHGLAEIVAPMPGKVVRVQVEAGMEIEKGAGIVVVEAMKMQNEMKAPRAGKLVRINVKPGDTVNAGDVLAVVE